MICNDKIMEIILRAKTRSRHQSLQKRLQSNCQNDTSNNLIIRTLKKVRTIKLIQLRLQ